MERDGPPITRRHRTVVGVVCLAAVAMLGMSYAAVPLYRMFCQATGFGGTTQVAKAAPALRGKRTLIVRFDANVGPGLDWQFEPETPKVSVRTGETATVFFHVANRSDQETTAQALYNVTPEVTGGYFDKISCFCFSEQRLGPHESADMPVVFFLDPALEQDESMNGVEEVTLSYTFYPVKQKTAAATPAR